MAHIRGLCFLYLFCILFLCTGCSESVGYKPYEVYRYPIPISVSPNNEIEFHYGSDRGPLAFQGHYYSTSGFEEGFAAVRVSGGYEFINLDGQNVFARKFEDVDSFSEGRAAVKVDGKWGFIDTNGNWIVPPNFDSANSFKEGIGCAISSGKMTIFGRDGQARGGGIYQWANNCSEGLIQVKMDTGYGYVDPAGKLIINLAQYDDARSFHEGLAAVKKGKWGFVDHDGNLRVSLKYDDVRWFSEGLAAVKTGNLWGYVDEDGREVIAPSYVDVRAFTDGAAPVMFDRYRAGDILAVRDASTQSRNTFKVIELPE